MKGNHIAEYRDVDPDTERPVLLYSDEVHEIYWLGIPEHTAFRSNIYLIKSGEEAIIVDPGHQAYFEKTRERVAQVLDPAMVSGLIICHQDPDVAASMPQWLEVNPEMAVLTTPRTQVLLPYYGVGKYHWHDVVEEPSYTFKSGKRIHFTEAPYLHFAGAFTSFDESSGFLFSGDIWAAIQLEWRLIVDDFEAHESVLDLFHVDYMASNIACRGYIEKIRQYRINAILPQHGSIIDSNNVDHALHYLESLVCGTDIIYPYLTT
ncbi:MAG: MBL fold metallo-hydrolase [Candidatus Thiodiazotropha endolucinida]|nr:MBL fold metallo-hydrolase [Candidatus Thiodiazotropha taylori]MCG8093222.1 MBL fold metallo-hydrolase [Candidatus Thiodiazotropha endolucinida]MCG8059181.1 MBL fold metallo-hydrolase [Candidatus Thiodiazotropha taylori]MCG8063778.1 MBL fold metallo-hydrolase [Candidatus Thiodiazotropha taylori]MCW4329862.1 MBL fold metallo-hydrolase [Candidatus Thiodiazotropha endolucinida]